MRRIGTLARIVVLAFALVGCSGAETRTSTTPRPTPAADRVVIDQRGLAIARSAAPRAVRDRLRAMVAAANTLVGKPRRFGGGHRPYPQQLARYGRFTSSGPATPAPDVLVG